MSPDYWDIPKQGTPEWNAQVYEPTSGFIQRRGDESGADSRWSDFARPGNVEDRSNEQLTRDQLAALKARGTSYTPGPEAAASPLSAALGLGDLPAPRGMAAAVARPQGIADNGPFDVADNALNNVPRLPSSFNEDNVPSGVNPYQGPTMPSWQSSIPLAYRNPEVTAAVEAQARRFDIPPEAITGVAGVEGSGSKSEVHDEKPSRHIPDSAGGFQDGRWHARRNDLRSVPEGITCPTSGRLRRFHRFLPECRLSQGCARPGVGGSSSASHTIFTAGHGLVGKDAYWQYGKSGHTKTSSPGVAHHEHRRHEGLYGAQDSELPADAIPAGRKVDASVAPIR